MEKKKKTPVHQATPGQLALRQLSQKSKNLTVIKVDVTDWVQRIQKIPFSSWIELQSDVYFVIEFFIVKNLQPLKKLQRQAR